MEFDNKFCCQDIYIGVSLQSYEALVHYFDMCPCSLIYDVPFATHVDNFIQHVAQHT